MAFVLDASSTLPWCFADEATPVSDALLRRVANGEKALVPAHWPTEILNALLRGKRRKRITDAELRLFLVELEQFQITVAPALDPTELIGLLELAERHGLSVWYAVYLDLARRSGIPLATGDAVLLRAALTEGVPTISGNGTN